VGLYRSSKNTEPLPLLMIIFFHLEYKNSHDRIPFVFLLLEYTDSVQVSTKKAEDFSSASYLRLRRDNLFVTVLFFILADYLKNNPPKNGM